MHRHPCPPKPSGRIGDDITGADQRRPQPFLGRSIGPASGISPALALCRAVVPGGGNPTVPPTRRRQHRPRRGSLATARGAAFPPPVGSCRRQHDRPRAALTGHEESRAGERAPGIEPGARCCREHEPGTTPVCQRRGLRFETIGTALPFPFGCHFALSPIAPFGVPDPSPDRHWRREGATRRD